MSHRFIIEKSANGHLRIAILAADGAVILTSTPIPDVRRAQAAIDALGKVLARDWHYRIMNPRKAGPCFKIHLPRSNIEFVSPVYSSCDAMERVIQRLQHNAWPSTFALHSDDIANSSVMCQQGDETQAFTARLRALA